ncbi:PREDICTED: protein O-linked-mannose beta-1,4-N-acetylglucosaminyltransferase 2-like [Ipomoea nil]|uniref:protein O-linked-mannose beta-1,4-N-acetylglucosaminyltransferase 2-like n=1 Tax=Ipomoea nil TaxID=35883 RepID=UPI0009017CE5|nr:PREDICTED: protein O-linked-mannose beta-1,4-N-acetylglucosaminyltransferase 2-like [Ipomoea nil]
MEMQNGWKYEAIVARSFSRQDRKTMGWCATLIAIFILIFTFCIFYITPNNHLCFFRDEPKPICDLKQERSETCEASGDIRVIIGNSSTIFVVSDLHITSSWTIRPYARKRDQYALKRVRNLTIAEVPHHSDQRILPRCTTNYDVPAVVFSTGGFAGNLFHDFTDLIIPLYLTSREFEGEVQFLVTDKSQSWVDKFKEVLQRLSRYEIIDLDGREKDGENAVLCFPSILVGLKANKEFSINPSSDHISMKNFTAFLRNAYNLKRDNIIANEKLQPPPPPRLLVIARNKTRRLLNAGEVSAMAEDLGFEVVVQETDGNMSRVSRLVNGFDVMVGVHGAGLSNMVFLPENAVVVQIVGLGMNWVARNDFELPSMDMGLRYLEYKVGENESSLKNSSSIAFKGWIAYTLAYLIGQDFMVDVNRFRGTLLKALELLHPA